MTIERGPEAEVGGEGAPYAVGCVAPLWRGYWSHTESIASERSGGHVGAIEPVCIERANNNRGGGIKWYAGSLVRLPVGS